MLFSFKHFPRMTVAGRYWISRGVTHVTALIPAPRSRFAVLKESFSRLGFTHGMLCISSVALNIAPTTFPPFVEMSRDYFLKNTYHTATSGLHKDLGELSPYKHSRETACWWATRYLQDLSTVSIDMSPYVCALFIHNNMHLNSKLLIEA